MLTTGLVLVVLFMVIPVCVRVLIRNPEKRDFVNRVYLYSFLLLFLLSLGALVLARDS